MSHSLEPGNRSRGYGDADSLYGWQIDHIVPQSLLRDRVDLNRRQAECHPSSLEDGRGAKEEDAVKAFAGSIRVDEGQLYGSAEG